MFLQYPRYQNLKGVTDYKQACKLIKADGWATDVKYTEKLIGLIEKYGLNKYDEEVLEVVEKCKIIINGKEHTVDRILKNGTNYIKIRDVADAIGYDVTSKGSVAVLTKK